MTTNKGETKMKITERINKIDGVIGSSYYINESKLVVTIEREKIEAIKVKVSDLIGRLMLFDSIQTIEYLYSY
ncbi:MAG TPA: hypothetical protein VEL11_09820 [Candidatus Bathyarchaeia archaeon]|nr:hypothetical protein [Candidatus Bathyarchaeia archaeon]